MTATLGPTQGTADNHHRDGSPHIRSPANPDGFTLTPRVLMTTDNPSLASPRDDDSRSSALAREYRAALEGCALVDLQDREQIELTGADRATFLHNFCTQEIRRLPAGQGAEAFITSIKGRIVGHVLVFAGEQALWMDAPPGSAAVLVPHLDRYLISEDVQIRDCTGEWAEFALIGPQAAHIADRFLPGSGAFGPFQHGHAAGVTVRRCDFTSQPGWLIGAAREQLPALREQAEAAGAAPCSRAVFEALRIEAGFPIYGVDLTEDHLAHEAARTRQAISFTKGCYLGQEPIARLESMGHTNRELRSLRLADATVPSAGDAIISPADGAAWGAVSSAALSPLEQRGVALTMLRREACTPGTEVIVQTAAGPKTAIVI